MKNPPRAIARGRKDKLDESLSCFAGYPKFCYRKIWDYLEVMFDRKAGYFRETKSDQVMEKVDKDGNILGFSILKVSKIRRKPLQVALT